MKYLMVFEKFYCLVFMYNEILNISHYPHKIWRLYKIIYDFSFLYFTGETMKLLVKHFTHCLHTEFCISKYPLLFPCIA